MSAALAWDIYLRSHAMKLYGAGTNADALAARAIGNRIRTGDLTTGFSARDTYRNGWALLSDRQTVVDALVLPVELGHLCPCTHQTNGRTATVYLINPKLGQAGE